MTEDRRNFVLFAIIAGLILFGWPVVQEYFFPTARPPVASPTLPTLATRCVAPFLLTGAPAAYYVAFGPHGPRAPIDPPGTVPKVIFGVSGLILAAGVLFYSIRASGESGLWPRFRRVPD